MRISGRPGAAASSTRPRSHASDDPVVCKRLTNKKTAMLQNSRTLYGRAIQALDGDMGNILDILFDDASWAVRYLVLDPKSRLNGRKRVLSPEAFDPGALSRTNPARSNLSRAQIESAPPIEAGQPLSRQYEAAYYRHYGWPPYWTTPPIAETLPASAVGPAGTRLRSVDAATDFRILASDGVVGRVKSFTIDIDKWTVAELVVEVGHWYAGKEIRIQTKFIERFNDEDATVSVALSKADIRRAERFDIASAAALPARGARAG